MLNSGQNRWFLSRVTLKFDGWPWKTIGHLFYATLSFVHHFKAIGEFKLKKLRIRSIWVKNAIFVPCDLKILWMALKNNMAPLLCCFKLCASFHSHRWIQTKITVQKRSIRVKIRDLLSHVTLKSDRWPWKTIGHLFYATSSFVSIGEFKLELQYWIIQFGSKLTIFVALWPWDLTDDIKKNNRAPLLSNIKLCASFHHHRWIQTGVTVRKQLCWVMTSVTLTFDIWPWPLAWTSLLSLVITPENFVMIRWQEQSENGVLGRS